MRDPVLCADGETFERAAIEGEARSAPQHSGAPAAGRPREQALGWAQHSGRRALRRPLASYRHCAARLSPPPAAWIARQVAAGQQPCSPLTNLPLAHTELAPNRALRRLIGGLAEAGLLT